MKIVGHISEHEELQFDKNRALEWPGSEKINFNFDNFRLLKFSCTDTYDSSTELSAKDFAIKTKKQIKNNGLIFTSSMTWICHLDMAIKRDF